MVGQRFACNQKKPSVLHVCQIEAIAETHVAYREHIGDSSVEQVYLCRIITSDMQSRTGIAGSGHYDANMFLLRLAAFGTSFTGSHDPVATRAICK
jgi:hypothetical protein